MESCSRCLIFSVGLEVISYCLQPFCCSLEASKYLINPVLECRVCKIKKFALGYNKPQLLYIISSIDNILIEEFNELTSVYNLAIETQQLSVAVTLYSCV